MKTLALIVFFGIVTFPAYKALRHPGMISGHDAESVVFRSMEFRQALRDGHFPVRWSKRLDFGLGLPTFTFAYNFPYYLGSLLGGFGLSEIWTFKLLLAASFPLSGYFAYRWLAKQFSLSAGIVGGLFYTYVPYHFANVYVRGALGETMAATLTPLLFAWTLDLARERNVNNALRLALGVGGLALSHNMYLIVLLPVLGLYYFVLWKKFAKEGWKWLGVSFGLGLGLAGYYLIPALSYKNLTHLKDLNDWFLTNNNFLTMAQMVTPRWGFGGLRVDNGQGTMSVQIGIMHTAVIFIAGWLTITGKILRPKRLGVGMWGLLAATLFMMQGESLPVWRHVAILQNLQFPWRLMFVVNIITAFFSAAVSEYWMNLGYPRRVKLAGVAGSVIALIAVNRGYWHVQRYYFWADPTTVARGYPGTLTMLLEETPKWHVIYEEANPYHLGRVSKGQATTHELNWKTNYQKMAIRCDGECVVSFKTHYWPGWQVELDGKKVKLFDPRDFVSQGLITFGVPSGEHIAEARLVEPPLNKVADMVSIVAGWGWLFAKRRFGSFQR